MSKYVIISPKGEQARQWIHNKRNTDTVWSMSYPSDSRILIVTHPDHLRGVNVSTGVLLDGWREMPQIKEILFMAMIHTQGTIPALKSAYESVEDKITTPKLQGKRITQIIIDDI